MKRDRWNSRAIFIFAAVGSAVGLGNIWRFPYLTHKFGGGAFLIPYILALIAIGLPLLILEFALGQKFQKGAVGSFTAIHPKFRGIGVAAISASFLVVSYYAVVLSWSLLYFLKSFNKVLPWASNSESYFFNDVLGLTASPGIIGGIQWPIFFSLLAVWIIIFFILRKGIKSLEKAVVITMVLPILLLIVLFFRGITLPGAMTGILAYIKPNFLTLLSPEIWTAAASQIFFTLSVGYGIMIAYASFNRKNQNITGDAYITSFTDILISLFAGLVVFSVIGYMATVAGVTVDEAVKEGPGLAFVIFPEALSLMPLSSLFAGIFFLVLLTLGLSSAFSMVEGVITVIGDRYKRPDSVRIALSVCTAAFLIGVLFTTGAGLYFLDIFDHFVTNYIVLSVGITSSIAIGWVYGAEKMREYINSISNRKIGKWWTYTIKFIIPIILIFLLGAQLYQDLTSPYGNYSTWAVLLGWASALIPIIIALGFSLTSKIEKNPKNSKQTKTKSKKVSKK